MADVVKSCALPSEKVPVAVNCCVNPAGTVGLAGVTLIDTKLVPVTVSVVEPKTPPDVAVICVVPAATPVASPLEPAAFEIVATDPSLDDHVTESVKSCVLPSENVPVAVNWRVNPAGIVVLIGVTSIDTRPAADAGEVPIAVSTPMNNPATSRRHRIVRPSCFVASLKILRRWLSSWLVAGRVRAIVCFIES